MNESPERNEDETPEPAEDTTSEASEPTPPHTQSLAELAATSQKIASAYDALGGSKGWGEIARKASNIDAFVSAVAPTLRTFDFGSVQKAQIARLNSIDMSKFNSVALPKTTLDQIAKLNADVAKLQKFDIGIPADALKHIKVASTPMRKDVAQLQPPPAVADDDVWEVEALEISRPELDALQAISSTLTEIANQGKRDGKWGKWGFGVGLAAIVVAVLVWLFPMG